MQNFRNIRNCQVYFSYRSLTIKQHFSWEGKPRGGSAAGQGVCTVVFVGSFQFRLFELEAEGVLYIL